MLLEVKEMVEIYLKIGKGYSEWQIESDDWGIPWCCLNLPPNNIGRCSFLIDLSDINGEERFDMKFIAS